MNCYSDTFPCLVGLRQGYNLSPILFSLFIYELYTLLCNNDVRGIQLFPDITECLIEVVNDCTYVGVFCTNRLSLSFRITSILGTQTIHKLYDTLGKLASKIS